jgi:hypothetical protein
MSMTKVAFISMMLTGLLAGLSAANATMPLLTTEPGNPSPSSCKAWARKQSDDAIQMWGIQEDGTSSHNVAIDRLARSCMGQRPPEIVGFGSSAGFDDGYCKKHPAAKICKDVKAVDADPRISASQALLTIPTRFGPVSVEKDGGECCIGTARFRSDRIQLGSPVDLSANLEGAFETAEGDVIVLSVPSARGMPHSYYVFLVNGTKMIDITPQEFGVSDDGEFKASQRGNEIFFNLGWDNGKHKRGFYRAGVIYMGSSAPVATTLPKRDCAYVLNELAECERIADCDNVSDNISMAVQRELYALENKPVFKEDNFYRLCKSVCIGHNYNAGPARKALCGY